MTRLALIIVLVCGSMVAAHAACPVECGDCNSDGTVSIIDALQAAQVAGGIIMPTPTLTLACDVEPAGRDSDVDILDALVMAQFSAGLPVNLGCFPIFVVTDGHGVPAPVPYTDLSSSDPDRATPDFACPGTTVFFDLRPQVSTTHLTITVSGMSTPTDVDLYVGNPGVPAGDLTPTNYLRMSRRSGALDESYVLACTGLIGSGPSIALAVHAFTAGNFTLQVRDNPAVTCTCGAPSMEAGQRFVGNIPVLAGPCPPLPCGPGSRQIDLQSLPAGTTRLYVQMIGPPPSICGDFDLWLGFPGVCAGDCFVTNFHGSLRDATTGWIWGNPLFAEDIDLSGLELAAYGAGPVAIGVSVFSGPGGALGNYTVDAITFGSGGAPSASQPGTSPAFGSISPCRVPQVADVADRYTFAANAGQVITVRVDTVSFGGAFDPQLELREFGLPGILAASQDAIPCAFPPPASGSMPCPEINLVAPTSTTYELTIQRNPAGFCRDGAHGAYRLEVEVDATPATLSVTCDDC